MNLYNETKNIMKKYNINASKKLGQNFLIDDEIVREIVDYSNITKEDLVIEIGPGLGTLTEVLLEKAGKVICIELDTRMIAILRDRFSMYNNFEIVNDDVLKVNLKKIIANNMGVAAHSYPGTCGQVPLQTNVKVVANLPYYITTPIIMKLLEENVGAAWNAVRVAWHAIPTNTVNYSNDTKRSSR